MMIAYLLGIFIPVDAIVENGAEEEMQSKEHKDQQEVREEMAYRQSFTQLII